MFKLLTTHRCATRWERVKTYQFPDTIFCMIILYLHRTLRINSSLGGGPSVAELRASHLYTAWLSSGLAVRTSSFEAVSSLPAVRKLICSPFLYHRKKGRGLPPWDVHIIWAVSPAFKNSGTSLSWGFCGGSKKTHSYITWHVSRQVCNFQWCLYGGQGSIHCPLKMLYYY